MGVTARSKNSIKSKAKQDALKTRMAEFLADIL